MKNKNALLATAAAALLLAPVATFAADSLQDDNEIYGRTVENIEATLAEYGIDATHVEAWGTALRVDALGPDGSTHTVLVDRDTLRPLGTGNGVASQTDVGLNTGSGWDIRDSVKNPGSLVD